MDGLDETPRQNKDMLHKFKLYIRCGYTDGLTNNASMYSSVVNLWFFIEDHCREVDKIVKIAQKKEKDNQG